MRKLFVLLLSISLYSCYSTEQIFIDYMQPGKINIPDKVERVAVVNNAIVFDENDKTEVTKGNSIINGKGEVMMQSLAELLAEANYFDEIVVCDSSLRQNTLSPYLSHNQVNDLAQLLDVDFIISIDQLALHTSRYAHFVPEWNCYQGIIEAKVKPTLGLYVPQRKDPLLIINANDSMYWDSYGSTELNTFNDQIDKKQMVNEASIFAASTIIKYLLPHWSTAERWLFINGTIHMRDAAIFVKENNWLEAMSLWKEAYKKSKKESYKMRLANNISLGYEMTDNLEESLKWAELAKQYAYIVDKIGERDLNNPQIHNMNNYIMMFQHVEALKKRIEELPLLYVQMQRQ